MAKSKGRRRPLVTVELPKTMVAWLDRRAEEETASGGGTVTRSHLVRWALDLYKSMDEADEQNAAAVAARARKAAGEVA